MNKANYFKNWTENGNNYILKGNPKNRWVGFQKTVLEKLIEKFDDEFNIIIWTDKNTENDYYCIPFSVIKHLFIDEHKTTGKYPNRWTSIILNHQFLMHSNTNLSVDLTEYYAKPLIQPQIIELDDDYLIENAKALINFRLGQSKFRKGVLKNFEFKCALSGITDTLLLTASHIVPWSHKKEFRGDISNGICLFVEYDAFFDKGFITFSDNLEIMITPQIEKLSTPLIEKLNLLCGKKLSLPIIKEIKIDYLRYHRSNIFLS